MVWGILLLVI